MRALTPGMMKKQYVGQENQGEGVQPPQRGKYFYVELGELSRGLWVVVTLERQDSFI